MSVGSLTIVSMYNGDLHFAKEHKFEAHGMITLVGKVAQLKKIAEVKGKPNPLVTATVNSRLINLKEVKMIDSLAFEELDENLSNMYTKVFMNKILVPGASGIIV